MKFFERLTFNTFERHRISVKPCVFAIAPSRSRLAAEGSNKKRLPRLGEELWHLVQGFSCSSASFFQGFESCHDSVLFRQRRKLEF